MRLSVDERVLLHYQVCFRKNTVARPCLKPSAQIAFCLGIISNFASDLFPSDPVPADKSVIDETYRCVICLTDPTDPRLCQQCAHFFCRSCLEQTYHVGSRRCPHCRQPFPLESYVRVPWLGDLARKVRALAPTIADECQHHPGKHLIVFCQSCNATACSTCWT